MRRREFIAGTACVRVNVRAFARAEAVKGPRKSLREGSIEGLSVDVGADRSNEIGAAVSAVALRSIGMPGARSLENSRRRSEYAAIYRPAAGAKAAGRRLPAGGHDSRTSKSRAARCLINLLEDMVSGKPRRHTHVRVSQGRFGMMLSLSRQTVNELLRDLEQESCIQRQRGWVRILDPGRLRNVARNSS
jgi:hypothetical protein